ncbi:MAG TPA: zinc ribbon domain-containing protein [Cyclobacteriaceae bacterium]|nr:zinc ribbon domain-containing protein [Cyclobacteriaceae bacterium]
MARTKECPSCAMEIKANSKVCPICGYEFAGTDTWIKVLAAILLIVFLYLMLF